jgi:ABC-type transport system substrate-binding protein
VIKKAASIVLILSILLLGLACKGSSTPPQTEKSVAPEPTAVKSAVVKSGKEDIVIKFTVPGFGSDPSPFSAATIQMLEENLGIDIDFETMEWGTFLNKLDSKELQMFSLGWVADYPDPQNFLEVLFHSQSAQNHYGYANPEVDALLDKARTEQDWDERMRLYRNAEQLISQDAPVIPTTFGMDYYLVKPWLEGLELSSGIVPILKDVRVTDPKMGAVGPLPMGAPYGSGSDIPNFDPHKAGDVESSQYLQEVYSGLVAFDPRTLKIIPDIAESWEVSEDGLVYTFYLRQNVKFHNGRNVTAHDFKWSIERAADPLTFSPTADTYLGDIVGVKEKLSVHSAKVSGVRVVDDYTLEIVIKEPIAYFLQKLTYQTAVVLDKETVGEMDLRDAFQVKANGTGPFRLAEYVPDDKLVLERSADYYGDRQGNVDKFVFKAGGSSMAQYENNEIWMSPVGVVDWERVTDPQNPLSKEFRKVSQLSFGYSAFNVKAPPFDDPKVRQAFAMAVDNELILKAVTKGMTPPATGILPPGMPGYDSTPKSWKYDPEAAMALLKESYYYPKLKKVVKESK